MDSKLRQVSRLLKRYDSDLFPKRFKDGALGIMRKERTFDFYQFDRPTKFNLWFARDYDALVVAVTDTWLDSGTPVDWGIEPLLEEIQKLDGWRDDGDYDRFCIERDNNKRNKERAFKNDMRARAADLRREFAKSVNDVNTSSLEKIEKRRKYDGYSR